MMVERTIRELGQLVPMPVDDLCKQGRTIDESMRELAHTMVNRIWSRLGEDGFVHVFRSVHTDMPQFGEIALESLPANSRPARALRAIQREGSAADASEKDENV